MFEKKKPGISEDALNNISAALNKILSHKCHDELRVMVNVKNYDDLCYHFGKALCCVDVAEALYLLDPDMIRDLRSEIITAYANKSTKLGVDMDRIWYIPEGD